MTTRRDKAALLTAALSRCTAHATDALHPTIGVIARAGLPSLRALHRRFPA
jgi:hypothetical protein